METHPAKSIHWWRAATAILLAALILQTFATAIQPGARHPASGDGLNHQPSTFGQMQALVTPEDPLVLQALADALNPPTPEPVTITAYGITYEFVPTQDKADFALILAWLSAHCVYTSDIDTHGISDYWQTPAETIALGSGDCEDYSILLCSLLRAYGVPADEVYVVVGYTAAGEAHSWLVEKNRTGIWRLYDSQKGGDSGGLVIDTPQSSSFTTSYCFNDAGGFYGEPSLPPGIYEFESAACSYPLGTGSVNSYSRYLNAGQKIRATIAWLPYTVEWPFNPLAVEPWNLNIYGEDGKKVFEWSGTDTSKTLEYAVEQIGLYRIEIVKRDNPARPARLTINPQDGWTTGTPLRIDLLRVSQPPFPLAGRSAVIETPPDTTLAVWQDDTPRIPAPVEVPRELLVQRALDTITAQRVSSGLTPVELGNITSAQAHADDMLEHRFVSGWGTDGTTPDERYILAGGQGSQSNYQKAVEINWDGNPALFSSAVMAAVEQAVKNGFEPSQTVTVSVSGASYYQLTTSSTPPPTDIDRKQYKLKPDRVNIGIAYDGEKLYLVLQYESFYVNFSQLPVIQDGVISSTGEFAPGVIPYYIGVSFRPAPKPLTAAQISYATTYGDRQLANISRFGEFNYLTLTAGNRSYFLDPHAIPLDMPPLDESGFDIPGLPIVPTYIIPRSTDYDFKALQVDGNKFSLSLNLDTLLHSYGKGVYVVSVAGISLPTKTVTNADGTTVTVTLPATGISNYIVGFGSYTIFLY